MGHAAKHGFWQLCVLCAECDVNCAVVSCTVYSTAVLHPPTNPLVLAAARVLKKNPELVEEFADKAAGLLHDKNQGVALSGVTLLLAICSMQSAMVEHYRQQVPTLCKMLRGLLQVGVAAATGSSSAAL
jgi:hypothetical protein